MLRAMIAGVSLAGLALAVGVATTTSIAPEAVAQKTKPAVKLEDKFATSADGVKIHYVASGKGPLVVLIHGFPDFSGSWAYLTPALNDAYRVVAMDTRGYNLSDKPDGVANYAMPKLVADVDAVINAEGRPKATVIGHDWGAAIAWNYAFAHMDKLDNLIIMSVPHPANMSRQLTKSPQSSDYARNFQKEGSEKNLSAEGLANMVAGAYPDLKPKYLEAFQKSSFAAMMNYYRANYPVGANAPPADAPPPTFPKISVPLMVIHGMKDAALLAMGHDDTWDQASKDTTILMIPDAGHFVQHDAADLVDKTIRSWLDIRRPKA